MSESQDAKNERRARARAQSTSAGENGLWDLSDLQLRQDAGVGIPSGARFRWTNLRDFRDAGLGGGGSPIESMDVQEFIESRGMTPQQYQEQYGGLPLIFNADGTATYAPEAQRNAWSYTPKNWDSYWQIPLAAVGAMVGANAMGLGQASAAGASTGVEGGLSALNSFDSGAMSQILGTGAAEAGAATGAGALSDGINWASDIFNPDALSTFTGDATQGLNVAKTLGVQPSVGQQVVDVARKAMKTPGAGPVANTVAKAIKEVTGADVSPDTVATVGKIVGAGLALSGGGGGGSGGAVGGTADAQGQAASDAMGLAREQWQWNRARADELWPQMKEMIGQQLDISRTAADRASSEWETYQSLYLPQERRYVETMSNWDNPDRRTQRVQEAVAGVQSGYDSAIGTMDRNMARSGVRPGSAAYTATMGDLTRARAADIAGATNKATRDVETEGLAGLERITNIGRGRPATSFTADQLAIQAGSAANTNANANTAATNAGLSAAQGWFNSGVNARSSQGNLQNTANQIESNNAAGIGRLLGQLFSTGFADGGIVGKEKRDPGAERLVRRAQRKLVGYADGGLVEGPGTETSDSIPAVIDGEQPAALSTGEAVLNAEAVRLVGEDFVNRINGAGLQRRHARPGNTYEGQARRVG